jgi:hypothetical protein
MAGLVWALVCIVPATGHAQCFGDCNLDGRVSIAEIIIGVNIALGKVPVDECVAFADAHLHVRIAQLIQGIKTALTGCRFMDNGDGTISDNQSGLMWEKRMTRTA